MAKKMTTSFSVSVTPRVLLDAVEGEHLDLVVLHEDIRTSLGGGGDVIGEAADLTVNTGDPGWANGTHAFSSADGTAIASDTNTHLICIKHSGFLYDAAASGNKSTTSSALTDEVYVKDSSGNRIAALANGEAMVIPRPGQAFALAKAVTDVAVEITIIGT